MIPFSIQVFIFKLFQLALKWSTKLLTFRTPELFSGPGSSLQLCEHIATRTGVKRFSFSRAAKVDVAIENHPYVGKQVPKLYLMAGRKADALKVFTSLKGSADTVGDLARYWIMYVNGAAGTPTPKTN